MAPLIYVMGPSGAGKDSVLHFARSRLRPNERIVFAHRYITRPPDLQGENHVALTDAEFDARLDAGLFAFRWQANGFRYGIGVEVEAWRAAGMTVVVNGSRAHFEALCPHPPELCPILITASPAVLSDRLRQRGREKDESIQERLKRAAEYSPKLQDVAVIENDGALEDAGRRLLALVRSATLLAAT